MTEPAEPTAPAVLEEPTEPTEQAEPVEPPDEPLGDAGKRALDAERVAAKTAKAEAAALREKLAEFEKQQMTDNERAVTEAREIAAKEIRETELQPLLARLAQQSVKALATQFEDADDAILNVGDPAQFLDADGVVDEAAIRDRLAEVLKSKPHLGKRGSTAPVPATSVQGAGGGRDGAGNKPDTVEGLTAAFVMGN